MTSAEFKEWHANSAPRPPRPIAGTTATRTATEAVAEPKKPRKVYKQQEDGLQIALFTWFALQYPEYAGHFFAVPNGGQRSKAAGAKLKRTGVLAGVSDTILAVATNRAPALFLELKVGKNKPSDAQRLFLERMQAQGYATAVAYSFDAARDAVRAHLGY